MQTFSVTLSTRELIITLLALRNYREAILGNDDDQLGDDLDTLLLAESVIKKIDGVRESQPDEE